MNSTLILFKEIGRQLLIVGLVMRRHESLRARAEDST